MPDFHRFNLALAYFVPPAFTNITWQTYMIFGTFCFVMIFHIFFFYPETAGYTLEEIEQRFDEGMSAWRRAEGTADFDKKVANIEGRGHAGHVEDERATMAADDKV
jgi:hypothetical protein